MGFIGQVISMAFAGFSVIDVKLPEYIDLPLFRMSTSEPWNDKTMGLIGQVINMAANFVVLYS